MSQKYVRANRGSHAPTLAIAFLLVIAIGIAAAGCGSGAGSSASSSPTSDNHPVRGGTLTVGFQGEPATLDPAIDWDQGWNILYATASGLLKYAPGAGAAGNQLQPDLAASMPKVSADGREYVFTLRKDLKFAPPSGRRITAEDFKWSFERMMSNPLAPGTYLYTDIVGASEFVNGKADHVAGYQAVNDSTIKITLNHPDPTILYCLAMPFASVVPKEVVESEGKAFDRHPVFAGPFMVEQWKSGQEITLKRNPYYWNADHVWLDGVTCVYSVTASTQSLRVQRGDMDVTGDNVPAADMARLRANPQWKNLLVSTPFLNTFYMALNVHVKPLDNPLVRKAIALAVNRSKLVKVFMGTANVLNELYPEGLGGTQGQAQYPATNTAMARALLKEAGYANGFKISLDSMNVDPIPTAAESLQYDLQQVGIHAAIQVHPVATFYQLEGKPGAMALSLGSWFLDYPDPSDVVKPLLGKESASGGGANASFWWNPGVEALMGQADHSSPQVRSANYNKISQIVVGDTPPALSASICAIWPVRIRCC